MCVNRNASSPPDPLGRAGRAPCASATVGGSRLAAGRRRARQLTAPHQKSAADHGRSFQHRPLPGSSRSRRAVRSAGSRPGSPRSARSGCATHRLTWHEEAVVDSIRRSPRRRADSLRPAPRCARAPRRRALAPPTRPRISSSVSGPVRGSTLTIAAFGSPAVHPARTRAARVGPGKGSARAPS